MQIYLSLPNKQENKQIVLKSVKEYIVKNGQKKKKNVCAQP